MFSDQRAPPPAPPAPAPGPAAPASAPSLDAAAVVSLPPNGKVRGGGGASAALAAQQRALDMQRGGFQGALPSSGTAGRKMPAAQVAGLLILGATMMAACVAALVWAAHKEARGGVVGQRDLPAGAEPCHAESE